MADTNLYVASKPTTASASTAIGATSMTVAAVQDRLGNTLTMADFGTKGRGVISPGKTKEEQFTFTGISSNTISGISWVTMKSPYTETSGFAKAHAAGERVILSTNGPEFYDTFLNKGNDETITGVHTFSETAMPRISAAHTYGVGEEEYLASKRYVDGVVTGGAADANTTTKGLAEEATQAEIAAGTAAGGTSARLFANPSTLAPHVQSGAWLYAAEDGTGSDDTYTAALTPALTAYTTGMTVLVKLTVANTGACTLDMNGLGAKDIKKYAAGAQTDLETGDIIANQFCMFYYDGTSMVLLNPTAAMPSVTNLNLVSTNIGTLTAGTSSNASALHKHSSSFKRLTYDMSTASGSSTIAHDLGVTPRIVKITSYSAIGAAVKSWSIGSYDGTTTQSNTIDLSHTATETSSAYAVKVGRLDSANYQTATVAYDGTNVTLTWTKTGTPTGNAQLFVESYA